MQSFDYLYSYLFEFKCKSMCAKMCVKGYLNFNSLVYIWESVYFTSIKYTLQI